LSPMGQIRIIDRALKPSDESRVDIWKYGTIYAALGVTSERFADWERRYGMDSLEASRQTGHCLSQDSRCYPRLLGLTLIQSIFLIRRPENC